MGITQAQTPDFTLNPPPGAAADLRQDQPTPASPPRSVRMAPMADSHARTIAKSISWRFAAFIMTSVIAWVVTGSPAVAASIGLADTLIKLVTYYLHERMWLRIRFGQPRQPEYDI